MNTYKIKIELKDSNPLVWRRVIVPAEITFNRLHDAIQYSMGWHNCHLYDFNIIQEKLRITCDEDAINEYEFYSKKKLNNKNDPHGFIANMLKIKPELSSKVKIDEYLTKWKNIEYVYDFGDYWKHNVILEEVIDDYEHMYPVCIEGDGACPPEDVGGILGYEEFLEIMKDKNHEEHETLKEWANNQNYRYTFDIENTNILMAHMLKLEEVNE
ncbi:plasmid pRiA4b ORF-3 family protein [Clostridium sp.]|uniref:plasmid pRiA4b ORF-3 family protein n=1 Tax=Clostridium sp. TaxID=1506 RepID=UPI00284E4458|nr:plasmid pRiA4b ORF-3 family protein [Clostridium sp.]MDR3593200.1 plasmid pRiA4b ORF-3 family protein [Clostridium sp.]